MAKDRRARKPANAGKISRGASRAWLLWLAGILTLTFLAYLPSLGNGFTNWDDPLFVLNNPLLAHPSFDAILRTPVAYNYHPLTIWSLVLNYRLSGLDPSSYHWLSLLLHLANTALVFVFIWSLTRGRLWASVVTSLFFGIHPMHVESVAWIAERKDVLYAFFYLAGLIAYVRYVDRDKAAWLLVAFVAFVLSCVSKPAAVVFPLTLWAIDFFRRRPFGSRLLLEKTPFLAVAVTIGILTLRVQKATGAIDPHRFGPTFQKVFFAAHGTVMYLVKLVAPFHLSAVYPYPDGSRPLGPEFYAALVLVAVGLPSLVYVFRRNRSILFGLAFFFINIILVLQIVTVGSAIIADRFTYVPYIGLFFAIAWLLDERPAPGSPRARAQLVLAGALGILALASLVGTWSRCQVWKDSESLWTDVIQRYPNRVAEAYCNRGWYYYQTLGRRDAALADLNRSLALDPKGARAWLDKGVLLSASNQSDSAYVCFDRALQIQPNLFTAWSDRGAIRVRKGDYAGAVADFSQSVEVNPQYREAYCNRALAYLMMKNYEKSIADSRHAIDLDPHHPDNYLQLGSVGIALRELGRNQEAVTSLDDAIRLAPREDSQVAQFYLYRSYAKWALGDRTAASSDARVAAKLGAKVDPSYMAGGAPPQDS